MFNRRVEEDLERIRKANLPPEERIKEEEQEKALQEELSSEETKFTAKDIFAMSIAVLSLILPFFLIMGAIIALLFFWILR